jgi:hypothetical protein
MVRKAVSNKLLKLCLVAMALFMGHQCFGMVTLDFEGMSDMALVTNQYAPQGVTFQEGIILTAYSSLNEIDFPPYSGSQVLGDNMGPIVADFITPVSFLGAYFTYSETLTLSAYDAGNVLIGTASSLGASNYGSNEFISLTSFTPISWLVIEGNLFGGSFTMDDFQFEPTSVVPAPGALLLGWIGMAMVGYARRRRLL